MGVKNSNKRERTTAADHGISLVIGQKGGNICVICLQEEGGAWRFEENTRVEFMWHLFWLIQASCIRNCS